MNIQNMNIQNMNIQNMNRINIIDNFNNLPVINKFRFLKERINTILIQFNNHNV